MSKYTNQMRNAMKNQNYWTERNKSQKQWILQHIADDKAFNKQLEAHYRSSYSYIQQEVDSTLMKYTDRLLSQYPTNHNDIALFNAKVTAILSDLKGSVKTDTYKEATNRIALYKVMAPYNQLELLKSGIGLQLVKNGANIDQMMYDHLLHDYIKEEQHDADILGLFIKSRTDPEIVGTIMKATYGATYSQRLWHDTDKLKAQLDYLLVNSEIAGTSYTKTAQKLRKQMADVTTVSKNSAERLIRTESARVETQATINLAHKQGISFFKWFAEPTACKVCADIADYDDGYGTGVYPERDLPILPVHTNCRCSIAPYWRN